MMKESVWSAPVLAGFVMSNFARWIQDAFLRLLHGDRQHRIQRLTNLLCEAIERQGIAFSLKAALDGHDYALRDLEVAKEKVYRTLLAADWADGTWTQVEKQRAWDRAGALELDPQQAAALHLEFARENFALTLARAMEDQLLDSVEEDRLRQIAASAGQSLIMFTRSFFREAGERFLQGLFEASVADRKLTPAEWAQLVLTTERLGLTPSELQEAIRPQARRFVEHVLTDALADGQLNTVEEQTLSWLVEIFDLDPQLKSSILTRIRSLRTLREIDEGKIPLAENIPEFDRRPGELVHFACLALLRTVRPAGKRAGEPELGQLILTDHRAVFVDEDGPLSINYRKLVHLDGSLDRLLLYEEGGISHLLLLAGDEPLAYPVLRAAANLANHFKFGAREPRIPREIRMYVWQRDHGRCSQCGAEEWLRYELHKPLSRGGTHEESNVILSCRKCVVPLDVPAGVAPPSGS